jgi:hypothetical protein
MKRGAVLFWSSTLAAATLLVLWCGGGAARNGEPAAASSERETVVPADLTSAAGDAPRRESVQRTGESAPALRFARRHRRWIREPSLLRQLVQCADGAITTTIPALAPGRYTLRAFEGDLVFEPAIDVAAPRTSVEVRWKER